MAAIADLLDQVRERCNFNSDNELATAIGLKRQTVHQWRHGLAPVADERIAQLCALAKADGPTWLAMIHAERAQSATERALWRLMLDRLSAVAAVVALVCVSLPGVANAKPSNINGLHESTAHILYIMFRPDVWSHMRAASSAALSVTGGCCRRQELPRLA